jgi:hypothetical protein
MTRVRSAEMSVTKKPDLKLGYAEYVLFPDDGKRHEIMDGDHYMTRGKQATECPRAVS